MSLFDGYWPWWLGALALAAVAIGYWLAVGRPFGVSGFWLRVLRWREQRAVDAAEAQFADDDELSAALLAATLEEFGELGDEFNGEDEPESEDGLDGDVASESGESHGAPVLSRSVPRRVPVDAGVTFLVMILVGGFLGGLGSEELSLHGDMGPAFSEFFGAGWVAVAVLLVGGVLVGCGTSMAGGCTSGHGLNGCASGQPGSLVATVAFFGTAVVVSLVLGASF